MKEFKIAERIRFLESALSYATPEETVKITKELVRLKTKG